VPTLALTSKRKKKKSFSPHVKYEENKNKNKNQCDSPGILLTENLFMEKSMLGCLPCKKAKQTGLWV
jgi:hypothetical protein